MKITYWGMRLVPASMEKYLNVRKEIAVLIKIKYYIQKTFNYIFYI